MAASSAGGGLQRGAGAGCCTVDRLDWPCCWTGHWLGHLVSGRNSYSFPACLRFVLPHNCSVPVATEKPSAPCGDFHPPAVSLLALFGCFFKIARSAASAALVGARPKVHTTRLVCGVSTCCRPASASLRTSAYLSKHCRTGPLALALEAIFKVRSPWYRVIVVSSRDESSRALPVCARKTRTSISQQHG